MSSKLVLVFNFGSSSLKFAIINVDDEKKCIYGLAECLGSSKSKVICKFNNLNKKEILKEYYLHEGTHKEALDIIVNSISKKHSNIFSRLIAIGHRVVHGGEQFTQSVIIDSNVIQSIKNAIPFAPLHNPAHLIGIYESFKKFPDLIKKNVAVFDTAFHQTMPKTSYLYALPYSLYEKYSIRRYGAHGISHWYVTNETSKILKRPLQKTNIITCHLGNGSSLAAIRNGKCVDTSMGLTPLEGLVMGTRCGDIDPSIIFYLYNSLNMSIPNIHHLLSKKSGLLGITGNTSDCRDIEKKYELQKNARLAIDIYCHRLAKYIGAYSSLMENRLDAITFTGGIGENSSLIRFLTLKKLSLLNVKIDVQKNSYLRSGKVGKISTENSIPVFVIPTNEELVIAKDAAKLSTKLEK